METRHSRLYIQGLDSIERRRQQSFQLEAARDQAELRECSFQPSFYSLSSQPSITPIPKQYQKSVTRLRKAIADRNAQNEMLTPREPMRRIPLTSRLAETAKPDPTYRSIIVEVTKNGVNGAPLVVGDFEINARSDCAEIARSFAAANCLSRSQKDRLVKQLERGKRRYFN
jgi:hypothetical protein